MGERLRDGFAAIISGRPPGDWCRGVAPAMVVEAADDEGVVPLLVERLSPSMEQPVRRIVDALTARRQAIVVADVMRERELIELTQAFAAAGVGALLVKGVALAYGLYPRPDLRPRLDSDVLVDEADRGRAAEVLVSAGYEPIQQFTGALVSYQAPYVKRHDDVTVHVVDLHWRLANPQPFGDVLTYAELDSTSRPLARLGSDARAPGLLHSLVLACVHRVAHHAGGDRLIWLHDIDLIARRAEGSLWSRLVELAGARGVGAICADGLRGAQEAFDTPLPPGVVDRLARDVGRGDRTASYLRPRRHATTVARDFWGLKGWRQRAQLVRQHALPPASYMRDVYAPDSHAPLPVLYVRRAWRGARRWLSKP